MVQDLDEATLLYRRYLGMEPRFSEDLTRYGLKSAVLPVGRGTFVDLLQPIAAESAAARYLARLGTELLAARGRRRATGVGIDNRPNRWLD